MTGFLDKIFDTNNDGKLDMFEKTTTYAAFTSIVEDSEEKNEAFDESDENVDISLLDEFQKSELNDAGLDESELELMDDDERREAIEDAGLDPEDYI